MFRWLISVPTELLSNTYINDTQNPKVFAEKKYTFSIKHNVSHSGRAEPQETKDDFAIM